MNILAHDPRSRKEGICFSRRGARMFTTHDAPLDLMHVERKSVHESFHSAQRADFGAVERPDSGLYRFYRSSDSVKVTKKAFYLYREAALPLMKDA